MNDHWFPKHARLMRLSLLGACTCMVPGMLASSSPVFAGPLPIHPAKVDPTCAGNGCDGTDPYATLCAGQPFDHEQVLRSAPITFDGQQFGVVQRWYSPLCQTTRARTVAFLSPLLLEATLTLPAERFSIAAWDRGEVSSPQAFAPVALARASGEMVRNGRLASGCASLVPARCAP